MPLAQDTYLKIAGNTVINTELFGLSQGLENVIGTGGAAQGFTNADVKGPIPNPAVADFVNYVEIPMNVFIRNGDGNLATLSGSGLANAFPPTTLIMPFTGSLSVVVWQSIAAQVIGIYRNDRCVVAGTLAASNGFATGATVGSPPRFKKGETLTVVNWPSGASVPAIDSALGDEVIHNMTDYWFWFIPEDP